MILSIHHQPDKWIHLKTSKPIPYVAITDSQWNEIVSLPFNTLPSEEIVQLVRNTEDKNLEQLNAGTAYEACYQKSTMALQSNICWVWSNIKQKAPRGVPVILLSGEHKVEKVLIPADEYAFNFK